MNKDFYALLVKRIKSLRLHKNITQQQLADKIGNGHNFTCKIENTFSKPSLATLIKIANALGVIVSQLTKFD